MCELNETAAEGKQTSSSGNHAPADEHRDVGWVGGLDNDHCDKQTRVQCIFTPYYYILDKKKDTKEIMFKTELRQQLIENMKHDRRANEVATLNLSLIHI